MPGPHEGQINDNSRKILSKCREAVGAGCGYLSVVSADGKYTDILIVDTGSDPVILDVPIRVPVNRLDLNAISNGKIRYRNSITDQSQFLTDIRTSFENILLVPVIIGAQEKYLLAFANKEGGFGRNDRKLILQYLEPFLNTLDQEPKERWPIPKAGARSPVRAWTDLPFGTLSVDETFLHQSILDSLDDYICVLDGSLTINAVNRKTREKFKDQTPLEGKKCYQVFHFGDSPCETCPSLETLRTGRPAKDVKPMPGNPERTIELTSHPLRRSDNRGIGGVIEIVRDITESANLIKELENRNHILRITSRISSIFSTADYEEMFADVLDVVLESLDCRHGLFGYVNEKGDMVCPSLTRDIWELCQVPKKSLLFKKEEWQGHWGEALRTGKTSVKNMDFKVPEGHLPVTRAMAVPILYDDDVIGIFHVGNREYDFTGESVLLLERIAQHIAPLLKGRILREQKDRQLKASNQMFDELIRSAPVGIITMDSDLKISSWNPRAEKIFGWRKDEILGIKNPIIPPEAENEYRGLVNRVLDGDTLMGIETKRLRKDGRLADVRINTAALSEPADKDSGLIVALIEDVTVEKKAKEQVQRSEKELRTLFENMNEAFAYHEIVTDDNGVPVDYVFLEVNKTFEEMTGLHWIDIVGKKVTEIIPGIRDESFDWIGTYGAVALGKGSIRFEQYAENLERWYQVNAYSPQNRYFVVIFNDITERKKNEKYLMESRERLRVVLDSTNDAIFVHSMKDGGITQPFLEVNERACEQYGYSREELLKMSPSDLDDPEAPCLTDNLMDKLLEEGHFLFNQIHIDADGTRIPVEISTRLFEFEGETAALSIARDITERLRTERKLGESEERFRHIFEMNPDAICLIDMDSGKFTSVNRYMADLFGYKTKGMIGKTDLELGIWVRKQDRDILRTVLIRNGGTQQPSEVLLKTKDGRVVEVLMSAKVVKFMDNRHILAILKDISDLRSYEKTVSELVEGAMGLTGTELFKSLTKALYEILDADYLMLSEVDHEARKATTLAYIVQGCVEKNITFQLEGTPCNEVVKTGKAKVYSELVQQLFPDHKGLVDMGVHGYIGVPLKDNKGKIIGVLCAFYKSMPSNTDIVVKLMQAVSVKVSGEVIRLESQKILQRNNQLATVGQVASGIAHEINNPMATISACVEALKSRLERSDGIVATNNENIFGEYLDLIQQEVNYSSGIINDLLDFSRADTQQVKAFNLNDLIISTLRLIRMQRESENYRFETIFSEGIPELIADPDKIRQVLFIIIKNSMESMPGGGNIMIRTGRRFGHDEIWMAITDSGIGIRPAIKRNIFEPFYTTKRETKGTGLGLYIASSIVSSHMGHIDVMSEEGKGSTFTVRLPMPE